LLILHIRRRALCSSKTAEKEGFVNIRGITPAFPCSSTASRWKGAN